MALMMSHTQLHYFLFSIIQIEYFSSLFFLNGTNETTHYYIVGNFADGEHVLVYSDILRGGE